MFDGSDDDRDLLLLFSVHSAFRSPLHHTTLFKHSALSENFMSNRNWRRDFFRCAIRVCADNICRLQLRREAHEREGKKRNTNDRHSHTIVGVFHTICIECANVKKMNEEARSVFLTSILQQPEILCRKRCGIFPLLFPYVLALLCFTIAKQKLLTHVFSTSDGAKLADKYAGKSYSLEAFASLRLVKMFTGTNVNGKEKKKKNCMNLLFKLHGKCFNRSFCWINVYEFDFHRIHWRSTVNMKREC